jgi:PAS domain S-box-containing protein
VIAFALLQRRRLQARADAGENLPVDASLPSAPGVTDGKARSMEQALADAQAQLERVVREMAIPTMVWAEDGEVVLVNAAWTGISGYRAEEIRTVRDWMTRSYGERAEDMLQFAGCLFELEKSADNGERSIITASGETRIWHFFTAPLGRDARGRRMLVSNAIDVTEHKRINRRLQESDERLRFALEAAGVGQWELNLEDGNAFRTLGHDRIFGYAEPLPQWTFDMFLQHVLAEDRPRVAQAIQEAHASGGAWDIACRIRRADGAIRHIWTRASPQRDASGAVVRVLGIVGDSTREASAVEALQHADRRKDEFLATLAHELRNPLAPLRNSLTILREAGGASGDAIVFDRTTEVMARQVEHLVRLIDDLLDVSRISLDKLRLRRERVDLGAVLEQTVESCRPAAQRAGHVLELASTAECVPLDADPARLAQVFGNLINNAVKFTPEGGRIRVGARREGDRALVSVSDDGIGIPAEHLNRVFEMFSQVDATLDRSHGGLGIGLNLVSRLVEMHGGTIELKSEGLGRGSEFTVVLPVAAPAPAVEATAGGFDPQQAPKRPLRILVVDDNRDAADTLVMMLSLSGHETHLARDGAEAIERAEAVRPEAMLLDIGLPGLNGYEVCRQLRARPWAAGVAIIAVTGWGQDADRRRSQGAGFDAHLVKPASLADVARALAEATAAHPVADASLR